MGESGSGSRLQRTADFTRPKSFAIPRKRSQPCRCFQRCDVRAIIMNVQIQEAADQMSDLDQFMRIREANLTWSQSASVVRVPLSAMEGALDDCTAIPDIAKGFGIIPYVA